MVKSLSWVGRKETLRDAMQSEWAKSEQSWGMQIYRKVLAKPSSQAGVNGWARREGSNNSALLDF